jgi:HSP20 family protein
MANISRWDPFQEMLSLREAMNQLLEDSFVRGGGASTGGGYVPAMDLSETADAFTVEAAVPGLKPEDLNVTVENNVLTISGTMRESSNGSERNVHRNERRFGSFQRSLSLPNTVKADEITATLEHGVLTLNIPKAEAVKPRQISISAGGQGKQKVLEAGR